MFLRVRFILIGKLQGKMLPGSVDGLTLESRALYQHRQDPYRVPLFGELTKMSISGFYIHIVL